MLPEDGRIGLILPCYVFQTPATVERIAANWSMRQEMIPRTLFQGAGLLSKPLCFALLHKGRTRGMVGFALYHEAVAVARLQARYRALLAEGEGSMVGEGLARDLLSFRTRVLVLGDPAQLPPVKGEGYFINAEPDVMLTEVHRQAADNPIIRMSMDVREGRGLRVGEYGDSRVVRRRDVPKDAMRELIMSADQLLCGTNKTRQAFNARIREIYGRQGVKSQHHPVPGDRLVCLRNNRDNRLLNGGLWEVCAATAGKKGIDIEVKSLDEPSAPKVSTTVPEEFFMGTERSLTWDQLKGKDQFTYGYALTVHKSQGSQFDNVVLFDESRVFRDDADKWLYTAVTRAAERITVVV